MQKLLTVSLRFTLVTTLLLGLGYPLLVTVIAQHLWKDKANGQLLVKDGAIIGSRLIGQPFSGPQFFHSRPSAAGYGYDATASGGSNLGPTSQKLVDRIAASTKDEQQGDNDAGPVPIDLVTASASGLDPDITPAAAAYQARRVAQARGVALSQVEGLIEQHLTERQFGLLGERRVNVLQLNLALDALQPRR
ncbi:MAG: potassium-transporting ATPase subunit KdpC [Acidobacteriaceae bacterium]